MHLLYFCATKRGRGRRKRNEGEGKRRLTRKQRKETWKGLEKDLGKRNADNRISRAKSKQSKSTANGRIPPRRMLYNNKQKLDP